MTEPRFTFIVDVPDLTAAHFPDGAPEDISSEEKRITSRVQIAKTGSFVHPRYGRFKVSRETFDSFIANFKAGVPTDELPVDFDHLPDYGGSTEACGWIKGLVVESGKLFAEVEWNWRGAWAIKEQRYKYISPTWVMTYQSDDGSKRGPTLLAFALTNRPFFEGMASVSLSRTYSREEFEFAKEVDDDTPDSSDSRPAMEFLAKFAKALGLAEDATEDQVFEKFTEVMTASTVSLEDRAQAEGKVVFTSEEAEALKAAKPAADAKDEAIATLTKEVQDLRKDRNDDTFDSLFSAALSDPKGARVAPTEKETMRTLFDAIGREAFKTYLDGRTAIVNGQARGSGEGAEETPEGYDRESFDLNRRVEAYAAEKNISFNEALAHVMAEVEREAIV